MNMQTDYRACKWVTIHGETPRDSVRLELIGDKNNILTMDDNCSFRLMDTRKITS